MPSLYTSIERQTPDDISSEAIERFSHQVASKIEILLRTTTEGTQATFKATSDSVQKMLFDWMDCRLDSIRELRKNPLYATGEPDRNCVGMDLYLKDLAANCGLDVALILAHQRNVGRKASDYGGDTARKITIVSSSLESNLPSGVVGFPMLDGTVDLRVLSQALEARGYFPGETIGDEPDFSTKPWRHEHKASLPRASVLMVRVPLIDGEKTKSTGLPFWHDPAGTRALGGVFVIKDTGGGLEEHYPRFVLDSGRRADFELSRLRNLLSPTEEC